MSGVQTFWCEAPGVSWRSLRRYSRRPRGVSGWTCADGWHNAATRIEDEVGEHASGDLWPHAGPRWPTACELGCGYVFTDEDHWQLFATSEYQPSAGGEKFVLRAGPPGAMWDADWLPFWRGADGISLVVVLPNGHEWLVDSRASNCTLPDDDVHKCWVRHGDPRTEPVTVDKNGVTCQAGAGSGDWHGFLRNGQLVLA